MVLRKRAPPHLYNLSQGNARSEPRSPTFQISPSAKSASSSSPKRLTRPRRAQSSPQPRHLPSQESIYSPDLNTSPAFDLMPLEQAQRSPVRSTTTENPNPWADELVERPGQSPLESANTTQPVPDNTPEAGDMADERGKDRVPSILVAGTQRRMAAHEWNSNQPTSDISEWEHLGQPPSVPLKSNNPFLKPKINQNPWDDRTSRVQSEASSLSQDGASGRLGQDEGYIPMTARLSLFDMPEPESPWMEERPIPAAESYQQEYNRQSATGLNQTYAGEHDAPLPDHPPQPVSSNNQAVARPEHAYQQLDPEKLAPTHGTSTPGTLSSATTGSSHVLIELDESAQHQPNMRTDQSSPAIDDSAIAARQPQVVRTGEHQNTAPPPLPRRLSLLPSGGDVNSQPASSSPMSESEAAPEQKTETYSIRKVNWMDATGALRETPVLVQNKNGPCPLLALVNALVLRAGQDTQPPIVRALQTREQISLGLLIQALFDELISRLGPDDEFPDIDALSLFLTMLHTGMNVNPRLTLESDSSVGTFLQTSDIKLYGTFGVPLIHGWVVAPSTEANEALNRVAQYYEDIQLLPFRKQELEDRVFHGGSLTPDEEQAMKDIQAIQHFVEVENATQLSTFGLDQLAGKLPPGSFSILFRNDHFSTLYKHPESRQLYSLITDAGYSNHAEVVWESLVDVNGFNTGFFSGDFRPVGNVATATPDPSGPRTSSNTAHPGPNARNRQPRLSAQEQADADYAYALSLQYQEEERRASTGRSQQTPASEDGSASRGPRTSHPLGRSSRPQPQSGRPATDDGDAPPPTYEQAATAPVYHEPERRSSNVTSPTYTPPYPRDRYGRRSQGVPISTGPSGPIKDRNKECIIM
ncbi:hypothetical protein FE257_000920 [Aspergillus nanangensis]|uniref:MINDY deubiquitinase domain-containing protein n=1 Tax=Aspergillus nanangensis TaxID=2582783 RepID=A0AAD4CEC8_ASPNN|nr:hypothetical protein FE257_000920 [Aspergillus nanangensis]